MLSAIDPLVLALAILVTVAAAVVQGTIGFAFAIVSVPILATVDPRLAPVPQLFCQIPLSFLMLHRERHHAEPRSVAFITLGRVPGTYAASLLLGALTPPVLDGVIGGLTLLAVLLLSRGRAIPRTRTTETIAGFFSALAAYLSAMGGPPVALLYRDAHGPAVRANLAIVFGLGLLFALGGRLLDGAITTLDVELGLLLTPPTVVGLWLSRYLIGHVEGRRLRAAILAVSAVAALSLLARSGWAGWAD